MGMENSARSVRFKIDDVWFFVLSRPTNGPLLIMPLVASLNLYLVLVRVLYQHQVQVQQQQQQQQQQQYE